MYLSQMVKELPMFTISCAQVLGLVNVLVNVAVYPGNSIVIQVTNCQKKHSGSEKIDAMAIIKS